MGSKESWSRLGQDIITTLKHEFGWVTTFDVTTLEGTFLEAAENEDSISNWQKPEITELQEEPPSQVTTVELKMPVELKAGQLTCLINTMSPIEEEAEFRINSVELPEFQTVFNVPALPAELMTSEFDCFVENGTNSEDLPLALTKDILTEPGIKKAGTTYAQRLILAIPIERQPLDFARFTKDEIYFLFLRLMNQHGVKLGEAELWAVYAQVPLNLVARIWFGKDRRLKMYLHQQAVKPKMVYLIVGRLKKNRKIIQTVISDRKSVV